MTIRSASVEVLERADDPAKDLTGSVRRTKTITCIARERDGGPDFHRWIAVELNESFTDEHMRGSEVIGAVPGTPAWEQQQAEEPVAPWEPGPRPPLHVDYEAIVLGEYYSEKARKPKVFAAHPCAGTVEEPPDWVNKVVDTQGDHLRREGDGWVGYVGDGYPVTVKPWEDHVLAKYAPYTEVKP